MIKAVIFDFDGVIADTEILHFSAWREFYRRHDAELTREEWGKHAGGTIMKSAQRAKDSLGLAQPIEEICREKTQIFESMLPVLTPMEGFAELITKIEQNSMKTAIVSNNGREYVKKMLNLMKIEHHFDYIAESHTPKPAPDMFLQTAESLAVDPIDCLIIEDTQTGVESATNAGMISYAVPTDLSIDQDFSAARHLVPSLAEVYDQMIADGLRPKVS